MAPPELQANKCLLFKPPSFGAICHTARGTVSSVPRALEAHDTDSTLAFSMVEFPPPCSSAGQRARGQVGTLTSNLQPDLCRGIAYLIDSSAGVDASIPLLSCWDPQRPGAGALRGQNHFKTPCTKDGTASGGGPWWPGKPGVPGC